jgi:hypothetical protein
MKTTGKIRCQIYLNQEGFEIQAYHFWDRFKLAFYLDSFHLKLINSL